MDRRLGEADFTVTYFPKAGWEGGFCFGLGKTQRSLSEPVYVGLHFHAGKAEGGYHAGFPICFTALHEQLLRSTYQSKPYPHQLLLDATHGTVLEKP